MASTQTQPADVAAPRRLASWTHHERAQLTLVSPPDDLTNLGLLLWGADDRHLPAQVRALFRRGRALRDVLLLLPEAQGRMGADKVSGWWLSAGAVVEVFATVPLGQLQRVSTSVAHWALVCKWALELLVSQKVVIDILKMGSDPEAYRSRWRAAPCSADDRERLQSLVDTMPGVSRAQFFSVPDVHPSDCDVFSAYGACQTFVDQAIDELMRADTEEMAPRITYGTSSDLYHRLARSLAGPDRVVDLKSVAESHVPDRVRTWTESVVMGANSGKPRIGFRLVEPKTPRGHWVLVFLLIVPDGSELITVPDMAEPDARTREIMSHMKAPMETLIATLGRCVDTFPPIERALRQKPFAGSLTLSASEAWEFITGAGMDLENAGRVVQIPAALSRIGQRRVRARVRVAMDPSIGGSGGPRLLDSIINYRWEASLGEDTLTEREFMALVKHKSPLVFHRGEWVAIDPGDVARLQRRFGEGQGELEAAEALRIALAGEMVIEGDDGFRAEVVCDEAVQGALETLLGTGAAGRTDLQVPAQVEATLRAYQVRGFEWLKTVTDLGFGACLADDMGLGKTLQLLTLLADIANQGGRRFLVICPTSVLGNWRREIDRFLPHFDVVTHHGTARAETPAALDRRLKSGAGHRPVILLTSFALARRDCTLLQSIVFDALVLDEAQNIKNPEAAQSQAVRQLRARRRIALTGTPVENRLVELWSILDFLNPNLLGPQSRFKKQFAWPIERYGDKDAAAFLKKVTAPFVLRRLKTDPAIAPDLPEKITSTRYCPLTREQAALYQAVAEKALNDLAESAPGMNRQGRILSMLTAIKQICNHPAQYLKDGVIDPNRSGKLRRFIELIEGVVDGDGAALVFTQFKEMGFILESVLSKRLGHPVPFLHGSLTRQAREDMVSRFQSGEGSPVFIISLRAGGTGLNLTRANHVFHYDRWWNPAVEDQASDRAFRIGQTRNVTVHQLISQDTLEEKTHQLLEQKRLLAGRVIGEGETWLSELDDETLRSLITLGQDAVLED